MGFSSIAGLLPPTFWLSQGYFLYSPHSRHNPPHIGFAGARHSPLPSYSVHPQSNSKPLALLPPSAHSCEGILSPPFSFQPIKKSCKNPRGSVGVVGVVGLFSEFWPSVKIRQSPKNRRGMWDLWNPNTTKSFLLLLFILKGIIRLAETLKKVPRVPRVPRAPPDFAGP